VEVESNYFFKPDRAGGVDEFQESRIQFGSDVGRGGHGRSIFCLRVE
jgi:hypothetical protein